MICILALVLSSRQDPTAAGDFEARSTIHCIGIEWAITGDESPMWRAALNARKPDRPGGRFAPDWRADVDRDGFDWGAMAEPFRWNGKPCPDLASLAAESGIERNAVRVRKEDLFESWTAPVLLTLRKGSNAVDAGALLPNVNDDFAGRAPDLGAHESGRPAPHYGPRLPR